MKHRLLGYLFTLLLPVGAWAQTPTIDSLKTNDKTLRNPFSANLVTGPAYQTMVFRSVVAIGGLNISQGKAMGSSLTVDDKGASLTYSRTKSLDTRQIYAKDAVGSPGKEKLNKQHVEVDAPDEHAPKSRFVTQLTVKAQAQDGLVKLFAGGEYQKTLGFGGGLLWFMPVRSTFYERTKKDLQYRYWEQRDRDRAVWGDWYQPAMRPTWRDSSRQAICRYLALWDSLQQKKPWSPSYYQGDFLSNQTLSYVTSEVERAFMRRYLRAEYAIRLFLPSDWDDNSQYALAAQEGKWINDNLRNKVDCSLCQRASQGDTPVETDEAWEKRKKEAATANGLNWQQESQFLTSAWQVKVAPRLQRSSLKMADSLQKTVTYHHQQFWWFSVNALANTVELPFFNPGGGASEFITKTRDWFYTGQLALNFLRVGQRNNWYGTIGPGYEYRRQLDPTTLQTYERGSGQLTHRDSVRVMDQQQAYAADPGRSSTGAVQYGITYFHHASQQVGLSLNGTHKFGASHQQQLTLGVFTPLKAGEATVVVMPQVRWDSQGVPTRWSVGISLTTAIPAYVRSKDGKLR